MYNMRALEVLDVSHCNISAINDAIFPPSVTSLNFAYSLKEFPKALLSLAYKCTGSICDRPYYIGSVLRELNLGGCPGITWPDYAKPTNLINNHGQRAYYSGPALTPRFESLFLLNMSDIQHGSPREFLASPLQILFMTNASFSSVGGLVGGDSGPLQVNPNSALYYPTLHPTYQCRVLQLSDRPTSQVIFDPASYNYEHCQCLDGYFGKPPAHCTPCSESMEKLQACVSNGDLKVPHGYYPYPATLNMSEVKNLVQCVNVEACEPAYEATCVFNHTSQFLECTNEHGFSKRSGLGALCALGYCDRLCTRCEDDSFLVGEAECEECPATSWWRYAILGVLLAGSAVLFIPLQNFVEIFAVLELLVVVLLVLLRVGETWALAEAVLFLVLVSAARGNFGNSLAKSMIFYTQTLSALAPAEAWEMLHGVWDPLASFGRLKFVNLRVEGYECVFSLMRRPTAHLSFVLGVPIFLMVFSGVLIGLGGGLRLFPPMQRLKTKYEGLKQRIRVQLRISSASEAVVVEKPQYSVVLMEVAKSGLIVLYATFFEVSMKALSVFSSGDDDDFMSGGYSWISYSSEDYTTLRIVGGVGFAVYGLLVPLLMCVLAVASFFAIRWLRLPHGHLRFCDFLFEGYRANFEWFETVWIVRRLLVAIALAYFPATSAIGPAIVFLTLATSIVIQHLARPFVGRLENALELVSLTVLSFTYAVRQMLEPGALLDNPLEKWIERDVALYLVIATNVTVIMVFLLSFFSVYISAGAIFVYQHLRPQRQSHDDENGYLLETPDDQLVQDIRQKEEELLQLKDTLRHRTIQ